MQKPKKLILILLISIFTLVLFQIGNVKAESSVTVNVTSYFDEENQILTEVTNQAYGSQVSFSSNLSTQEGYTFVYWIYNGIIREDILQNYAFTVTSDTDLVAIFRPIDKFAAVFMDSNGHLIDVQYVLPSDDALDIDNGLLPTKPGYEISINKWSNDNDLTNITYNTIFVLQYTKIVSTTYSLSVTDGTGDGTYAYNSYATITADAPGEGLYFNYWKIGDRIVSNTPTYQFTVLEDVTIEAVYSEIVNQGIPMISIGDNLAIRDGYQTFLGHLYLPNGYELIEFGMIVSSGTEVIDLYSASITRYQACKYNTDTFEFVMSLPDSSLNSHRAYLVVKDANGNLMTLYDEILVSSPSYTYATDLFFSYYIEGSSYNKSIAIFNGTGNSVDLSSYTVKLYSNGASSASISLPLSGTLAHGDVYVISHASASAAILALTDLINSGLANFNGDDALELVKGAVIVDSIGQVGVDPGTEWTSNGVSTLDSSLIRNSSVTLGRADSTSTFDPSLEWTGYASDYIAGLDVHTMDGMAPAISSIQAYIPSLAYFVDDPLNLSGAYLRVFYADGSAETKTLTQDLISGFSTSAAGSYSLTITYKSKTDSLAYTVSEPENFATLLIYEVYGGGGNTGATYTNDYVVLYNNTTNGIDLSGYSVQYGSATGSTYTALNLTGTISAKSYYLISLASDGAVGSEFPITPNQSESINMSVTSGKIALVGNTDLITIASDPDVIDFVGYGSANEYKTAPTETLSSSLSAKRNSAIDTDDNSSDFSVDTPNLSYLSEGGALEDLDYSGYSDYYVSIDISTDVITDLALLLRSTIAYVSYGDARYVYTIYDNDSQVVLYDIPTSDSYRNVPATGLDGWGDGGDIITVDFSISLNREHVWACDDMRIMPINSDRTLDSYVGFELNEDDVIFDYRPSNTDRGHYSDLHNLWNALASPNITHSNHFFGEENGASVASYLMNSIFYPGDEFKGDIARILFYMTLMYPYLTLVDQGSPDAVEGSIYYGFLDVLMEWNAEDPVCYYEIQKNELIFDTQGNRNPFIDFYNQDFAELLFASGDPNILD